MNPVTASLRIRSQCARLRNCEKHLLLSTISPGRLPPSSEKTYHHANKRSSGIYFPAKSIQHWTFRQSNIKREAHVICRLSSDCPKQVSRGRRLYSTSSTCQKPMHRVFVALGSNMGDRFAMIEQACRLMNSTSGIRILRTSGLWETKAMYVVDQADFLNGVCEIETSLEPLELLDQLQQIEISLDRKKVIDKGPRTIDLDILLYGNKTIEHGRLMVPHKLMLERAFVLLPLSELIPDESLPGSTTTVAQHLIDIPASERPASTLTPLSPLLNPLAPLLPARKTHIMSILNLTPDSFSDGGVHSTIDLKTTSQTLLTHVNDGATIIDIGGQSTRPHAHMIGDEEEISRVLPMVRHLSSNFLTSDSTNPNVSPTPLKAAISIDTFRASVARAAIAAGAHIVNDISAGMLDPAMFPTVAELGCTVILMHMRGDPSTMTSKQHTSYPDGLIPTIGAELLERVRAAEAAGVFRWRIILDPGIGFAKTAEQNLELLRDFAELRAYPGLEGLPWVIGASRKGFIGKITGVKEAKDRVWGSAVAVAAAVQNGADVVRVHDVKEMGQVVKMADAIWRR